MDANIILKGHEQQKYVNILFPVVIQYLPYGHLMVSKISMMYIEVKTV